MTETLRQFVERASYGVEKIFKKRHILSPMVHMVCGDGSEAVIGIDAPTKDLAAASIKWELAKADATRMCWMDECWMKYLKPDDDTAATIQRFKEHGIRNEPDRVEAVMFAAEDAGGGVIMAHRLIERPAGRDPYLGALKISEPQGIEGRFIGLLPRKGTVS